MKDLPALLVFFGVIAGIAYVASRRQRKLRITWACEIYDGIKASGRINDGESTGAERWLNLALLDAGMEPRYRFARLEAVAPKPDITVNVDKLLVLERPETSSEPPPRPVSVEVVTIKPKALGPHGGPGLIPRRS